MTPSPIETHFLDYHFRSRLEARWAVFYNALKIPFLYEPDAFALKSGNYLPDFFLPEQNCYTEIKPIRPSNLEMAKCDELSKHTGKNVFLFFGVPANPEPEYTESAYAFFGLDGDDTAYWWCQCPHCNRLDIQFNGRADRIKCACPPSAHGDKGYNADSAALLKAYRLATTERFGT